MIVDEDCYMALDEDDKKKYVILDPSFESYKLHQLTGLDQFVPSKEVEMTLMPVNVNYRGGYKKRGGGRYNNNHNHSGNFHNQNPHAFGSNVDGSSQQQMAYVSDVERKAPYMQGQPEQQFYYQQETCEPINLATPMYSTQPSHQGWANPMIPFIPQQQQQQIQYAPLNYQHVMPYGNFTIPPPIQSQSGGYEASPGDIMNIISDAELSSSSINWQPKESTNQEGDDLPYNDVASLQFFYNLGVRYYLASGVRRMESVASQLGKLELNDNSAQGPAKFESTNEQAATKSEPPPVPTNTPVSTKLGTTSGPQGNRFHGDNRNAGNRRPFSNREESLGGFRSNWSNSRKEIKFNSNVKNVHKNEPKIGGDNGQSSKVLIQSQTFHASGNTQTSASHDKSSPPSPPFASPISPVLQEVPYPQSVQPFYHPQQSMMAPQQPILAQQPQQGVAMIFQVAEDGSYIHPMSSGIQYAHSYRKLLHLYFLAILK